MCNKRRKQLLWSNGKMTVLVAVLKLGKMTGLMVLINVMKITSLVVAINVMITTGLVIVANVVKMAGLVLLASDENGRVSDCGQCGKNDGVVVVFNVPKMKGLVIVVNVVKMAGLVVSVNGYLDYILSVSVLSHQLEASFLQISYFILYYGQLHHSA